MTVIPHQPSDREFLGQSLRFSRDHNCRRIPRTRKANIEMAASTKPEATVSNHLDVNTVKPITTGPDPNHTESEQVR